MTNENIKIEDNFLKQKEFDRIQKLMVNPEIDTTIEGVNKFPWYFRYRYYALNKGEKGYIDSNELDNFQCVFTHTFYDNGYPQSPYMEYLNPICDIIQPISISRICGNLLTRLPNIIKNPFHTDMEGVLEEKQKQWKTSIFYMNTNNGYTVFEDGTKVESVANRMLTFPSNMKHTGTSCTDEQIRVVINFNYFEKNIR